MLSNPSGQATAEYMLLLVLVALATLITIATLDNDVALTFENLFGNFASGIVTD
jgi:Flp pilus assembly pilin Flp